MRPSDDTWTDEMWHALARFASYVLCELTDHWACDLDAWDLIEYATRCGLFEVRVITDPAEAERLGIEDWSPEAECHVLTATGRRIRDLLDDEDSRRRQDQEAQSQ